MCVCFKICLLVLCWAFEKRFSGWPISKVYGGRAAQTHVLNVRVISTPLDMEGQMLRDTTELIHSVLSILSPAVTFRQNHFSICSHFLPILSYQGSKINHLQACILAFGFHDLLLNLDMKNQPYECWWKIKHLQACILASSLHNLYWMIWIWRTSRLKWLFGQSRPSLQSNNRDCYLIILISLSKDRFLEVSVGFLLFGSV